MKETTTPVSPGLRPFPGTVGQDKRLYKMREVISAKTDTGAEVSVLPFTFADIPDKLQATDRDPEGPRRPKQLNVIAKFMAEDRWREKGCEEF